MMLKMMRTMIWTRMRMKRTHFSSNVCPSSIRLYGPPYSLWVCINDRQFLYVGIFADIDIELMDGDRPYLDLNPHYQRNVVWTRKAKIMLIDSMFGGFFVPPVWCPRLSPTMGMLKVDR